MEAAQDQRLVDWVHQVTGVLADDSPVWAEIDEWVDAARVAHVMAHNRLGVMGHYYNGMLDIYTDMTRQLAYFGGHVEIVEVEELAAMVKERPIQKTFTAWHKQIASWKARAPS